MVNTFTISKACLLKPLMKALTVAGRRSTMPVLSNVMVDLAPAGSKIIATDLDTLAVIDLGVSQDQTATFLVKADKFAGMLKELDDGDIELSVNAAIMGIKQKATSFSVSLQDVKEFPEIPSVDEGTKLTVKSGTLKSALEKVDYAMSTDESRGILNGICLDFQANRFIAVATDGFRLACYGQYTEEEITMPYFVIPRNAITEIRNIILSGSAEDPVTILKSTTKVVFKAVGAVLACNLLSGEYPDYKSVTPKGNPHIISVEKEVLIRSLKKVGAIASNSAPVKITFSFGIMDISAEGDLGKSVDRIDTVYSGTELTSTFNIKFLLDMLPKIPDEKIIIEAPPQYGAYLFKGENSTNYFNIIMPMRL